MPKFLSKVLLALMFVLPFTALAQERVTVSGKVTSAEDKQPLIGVTVVTETLSGMQGRPVAAHVCRARLRASFRSSGKLYLLALPCDASLVRRI